jgi:hypothetical protein
MLLLYSTQPQIDYSGQEILSPSPNQREGILLDLEGVSIEDLTGMHEFGGKLLEDVSLAVWRLEGLAVLSNSSSAIEYLESAQWSIQSQWIQYIRG